MHVQRNPLHALAASVSAHSTGLEFNPQSRSNNIPCAYLPAVLKRHPTLYHCMTTCVPDYVTTVSCPAAHMRGLCWHLQVAEAQTTAWAHYGWFQPLAPPIRPHLGYVRRPPALQVVAHVPTGTKAATCHHSFHVLQPICEDFVGTCRLQRPRRRPGRPMVGFNHWRLRFVHTSDMCVGLQHCKLLPMSPLAPKQQHAIRTQRQRHRPQILLQAARVQDIHTFPKSCPCTSTSPLGPHSADPDFDRVHQIVSSLRQICGVQQTRGRPWQVAKAGTPWPSKITRR